MVEGLSLLPSLLVTRSNINVSYVAHWTAAVPQWGFCLHAFYNCVTKYVGSERPLWQSAMCGQNH